MAFFRHSGFDVVRDQCLEVVDPALFETITPRQFQTLATENRATDADAYFIGCTAVRSAEAIEAIEREVGRPVVTSNQAMVWHALRTSGIEDRVEGYGAPPQRALNGMITMAARFAPFVLACAAFMSAATARAGWPADQAVHLVAPFAPAGVVDVVGRLLAEGLRRELGQTVIIDNRPGAGGQVGAAQVMRADPDGYTLLLGGLSANVIAPAIADKPIYDPIGDFTHIAYIGGPPIAIVVTGSSDIRTLDDLIKHAKAGDLPGYASSGVGTLGHILMEAVLAKNGATLPHVPFNTAALTDTLSGRIPVGSFTLGSVAGQVQAGGLRILALSTAQRSPLFKDAPTLRELGYDLVASTWLAMEGPKGLPAGVVARLNAAVTKALAAPETRARLAQDGIEPIAMSPDRLLAFYRTETERWTPIARAAVLHK